MAEKYIDRWNILHNNKYDYSLVDYVNSLTKVKIICPVHAEFQQSPNAHLRGYGCAKCGRDKLRTSREDFIKKAIEIHGDKYNYSLVDYKNASTKVKIICNVHGEFEQQPRGHLSGDNCLKCVNISFTKTSEQFIKDAKEVHGDLYDYSKVNYTGAFKRVIIICPIHAEFQQTPAIHLSGCGCKHCIADSMRKTHEQFIKDAIEVHGDLYDYSKAKYTGAFDSLIIICKIHGEFEQIAGDHTQGRGCQFCYNKTEGKVKNFLISENIPFEAQYRVGDSRFDFLIDKKYILEIDGAQHFPYAYIKQNTMIPRDKIIDTLNNDINKMESVIESYPVVRLFQKNIWNDGYDWKNIILNLPVLKPNTLYIRLEESDLYNYHSHDFNTRYI